jgi:hypothetical protein
MRSFCRGCDAIAGTIHRAGLGGTPRASGNAADGKALAGCRLVRLDSAHHPCLGLDCHPPYSAAGGEKPGVIIVKWLSPISDSDNGGLNVSILPVLGSRRAICICDILP